MAAFAAMTGRSRLGQNVGRGGVARTGEGLSRRIERWFPDRQVLVRGPDRISAIMLSRRQQMIGAAVAVVGVVWLAGASIGIACSYRMESQAARAAQRLQIAAASEQAAIDKISAECVHLAEERDLAVAQADQMRDVAVAKADQARDLAVARAELLRDQAITQERQAAAADDEITQQLIRQTQATIGHVETIIQSTGLDPDRLAQLPAPAGADELAATPTPAVTADDLPRADVLSQEISRLQDLGNVLEQLPLLSPVAEVSISSPFGYRPNPWTGAREFHVGIDIRGAVGSPVYATAPGVVTFAGVSTGYGNLVIIDHGYGLTTRYSHLQKIMVTLGAAVAEHQEIGLLGNTGWSTGPHLLYETRVDGQPENPLNFIKATP
jgi:murein DD-endopeptidase MepM/ murein hydrolase activator NlpD